MEDQPDCKKESLSRIRVIKYSRKRTGFRFSANQPTGGKGSWYSIGCNHATTRKRLHSFSRSGTRRSFARGKGKNFLHHFNIQKGSNVRGLYFLNKMDGIRLERFDKQSSFVDHHGRSALYMVFHANGKWMYKIIPAGIKESLFDPSSVFHELFTLSSFSRNPASVASKAHTCSLKHKLPQKSLSRFRQS